MSITVIDMLHDTNRAAGVTGGDADRIGQSFTATHSGYLEKIVTKGFGGSGWSGNTNAPDLYLRIREWHNDSETEVDGVFSGPEIGTSIKGVNEVVEDHTYPTVTFHFTANTIWIERFHKYVFQFDRDSGTGGAFMTRSSNSAGQYYAGGRAYALDSDLSGNLLPFQLDLVPDETQPEPPAGNLIVDRMNGTTSGTGIDGGNASDLGQSFTTGETGGFLAKIVSNSFGGSSNGNNNAPLLYLDVHEWVNDTESADGGCFSGAHLGRSIVGANSFVPDDSYPEITFYFKPGTITLSPNTKYVFRYGRAGSNGYSSGSLGHFYANGDTTYDGGQIYKLSGNGNRGHLSFQVYQHAPEDLPPEDDGGDAPEDDGDAPGDGGDPPTDGEGGGGSDPHDFGEADDGSEPTLVDEITFPDGLETVVHFGDWINFATSLNIKEKVDVSGLSATVNVLVRADHQPNDPRMHGEVPTGEEIGGEGVQTGMIVGFDGHYQDSYEMIDSRTAMIRKTLDMTNLNGDQNKMKFNNIGSYNVMIMYRDDADENPFPEVVTHLFVVQKRSLTLTLNTDGHFASGAGGKIGFGQEIPLYGKSWNFRTPEKTHEEIPHSVSNLVKAEGWESWEIDQRIEEIALAIVDATTGKVLSIGSRDNQVLDEGISGNYLIELFSFTSPFYKVTMESSPINVAEKVYQIRFHDNRVKFLSFSQTLAALTDLDVEIFNYDGEPASITDFTAYQPTAVEIAESSPDQAVLGADEYLLSVIAQGETETEQWVENIDTLEPKPYLLKLRIGTSLDSVGYTQLFIIKIVNEVVNDLAENYTVGSTIDLTSDFRLTHSNAGNVVYNINYDDYSFTFDPTAPAAVRFTSEKVLIPVGDPDVDGQVVLVDSDGVMSLNLNGLVVISIVYDGNANFFPRTSKLTTNVGPQRLNISLARSTYVMEAGGSFSITSADIDTDDLPEGVVFDDTFELNVQYRNLRGVYIPVPPRITYQPKWQPGNITENIHQYGNGHRIWFGDFGLQLDSLSSIFIPAGLSLVIHAAAGITVAEGGETYSVNESDELLVGEETIAVSTIESVEFREVVLVSSADGLVAGEYEIQLTITETDELKKYEIRTQTATLYAVPEDLEITGIWIPDEQKQFEFESQLALDGDYHYQARSGSTNLWIHNAHQAFELVVPDTTSYSIGDHEINIRFVESKTGVEVEMPLSVTVTPKSFYVDFNIWQWDDVAGEALRNALSISGWQALFVMPITLDPTADYSDEELAAMLPPSSSFLIENPENYRVVFDTENWPARITTHEMVEMPLRVQRRADVDSPFVDALEYEVVVVEGGVFGHRRQNLAQFQPKNVSINSITPVSGLMVYRELAADGSFYLYNTSTRTRTGVHMFRQPIGTDLYPLVGGNDLSRFTVRGYVSFDYRLDGLSTVVETHRVVMASHAIDLENTEGRWNHSFTFEAGVEAPFDTLNLDILFSTAYRRARIDYSNFTITQTEVIDSSRLPSDDEPSP